MASACGSCLKYSATFICSRCKDMYYCDSECQRKHQETHKIECHKFKLNQDISFKLDLGIKKYFLNATIIELLPNRKYKLKIDQFTMQFHSSLKHNLIMDESQLKINSIKNKYIDITKNADTLDLYLQGRGCKNEMISLSKSIYRLNNFQNQNKDRTTSYFIATTILEYIYQAKYKWRLSCFWCNKFDVVMTRHTARHRCIEYGGHTLFNSLDDYSMYVFCDECNTKMNYDDLVYGCELLEHDICIQCVYKKKILPYLDMMEYIIPILTKFVDIDSAREIVEYIAGDLVQFK